MEFVNYQSQPSKSLPLPEHLSQGIKLLEDEKKIDPNDIPYIIQNYDPKLEPDVQKKITEYKTRTRLYNTLIDPFQTSLIENPEKYPIERVVQKLLGLGFRNGHYGCDNPKSLYEILYGLNVKVEDEQWRNKHLFEIWNNPVLAKMECRQVMRHTRYRDWQRTHPGFPDYKNLIEYSKKLLLYHEGMGKFAIGLCDDDKDNTMYKVSILGQAYDTYFPKNVHFIKEVARGNNVDWVYLKGKLPYTGYMWTSFTEDEKDELIKVVYPYLKNKRVHIWSRRAIWEFDEESVKHVGEW